MPDEDNVVGEVVSDSPGLSDNTVWVTPSIDDQNPCAEVAVGQSEPPVSPGCQVNDISFIGRAITGTEIRMDYNRAHAFDRAWVPPVQVATSRSRTWFDVAPGRYFSSGHNVKMNQDNGEIELCNSDDPNRIGQVCSDNNGRPRIQVFIMPPNPSNNDSIRWDGNQYVFEGPITIRSTPIEPKIYTLKNREVKKDVPSERASDMEMPKGCAICGEHLGCEHLNPTVTYKSREYAGPNRNGDYFRDAVTSGYVRTDNLQRSTIDLNLSVDPNGIVTINSPNNN